MYFTILLAITIILALILIYYINANKCGENENFIDLAWNTRTTPVNLFQETESRDTRYYSDKGSYQNRMKPLTTMIEPYPMPNTDSGPKAENNYIVPNYAESLGSYF
jgi:hypothetical protein